MKLFLEHQEPKYSKKTTKIFSFLFIIRLYFCHNSTNIVPRNFILVLKTAQIIMSDDQILIKTATITEIVKLKNMWPLPPKFWNMQNYSTIPQIWYSHFMWYSKLYLNETTWLETKNWCRNCYIILLFGHPEPKFSKERPEYFHFHLLSVSIFAITQPI